MVRSLGVALVACILVGCQPERPESPTKGHLQVLLAESAAPILLREVQAFEAVYGPHGATVDARIMSSREAVSRFVLDTIRLIISTVPLTPAEGDLVRRLGDLTAIAVAYDGVVAVVHHTNPVERLTTTELADILRGRVNRWEQLRNHGAKRGTIRLLLEDSSDVASFVERRLLHGSSVSASHRSAVGSLDLLRELSRTPDALGLVGLAWIDSAHVPAKPLEVAETEAHPDTLFAVPPESAGSYYSPHPANIYRSYYPLKRAIMLYAKSLRGDLASGFGTYVANKEGQRIFLEGGLVPGTQPIRLRGVR